MNLSNLAPAPWTVHRAFASHPSGARVQTEYSLIVDANEELVFDDISDELGEFIVLARNAFAGDPEALAWWETNREKCNESQKA